MIYLLLFGLAIVLVIGLVWFWYANRSESGADDPEGCPAGTFEDVDGSCQPYTSCVDGEFEVAPPTPTADRECAPVCPPGEVLAADSAPVPDHTCAPIGQCDPSFQYEVQPADPPFYDTECAAICPPGEVLDPQSLPIPDHTCVPVYARGVRGGSAQSAFHRPPVRPPLSRETGIVARDPASPLALVRTHCLLSGGSVGSRSTRSTLYQS